MTKALRIIKSGIAALFIAVLAACGGGGSDSGDYSFLAVDNLNVANGVVCVEDIYYDAYSASGQQVARDLIDFYGTYDFSLNPFHRAYSAPTYCNGPTSNYVPYAGLTIDASYYYDVIVPWVTARR